MNDIKFYARFLAIYVAKMEIDKISMDKSFDGQNIIDENQKRKERKYERYQKVMKKLEKKEEKRSSWFYDTRHADARKEFYKENAAQDRRRRKRNDK